MSGPRLVSDCLVGIDSAATPDYLGAASSDGVLRTGSTISYTDGGNYVTLAVNQADTFAWTGAHTWGASGTGVNLSAYSNVSGDDLHWIKDGNTGGGGKLSLDGDSELEVVGKASFGTATMGGTYGISLLSAQTTIDPQVGETAAAMEFVADLDTSGSANGIYGFQMTTRTNNTVSTLVDFSAYEGIIAGNHSSGTCSKSASFNATATFGTGSGSGVTTRWAAFRANAPTTSSHTLTNAYGFYMPTAYTAATNNWNIWLKGGNSRWGDDNAKTYWGTADDAYFVYDGSNFICSVAAVTSASSLVIKDAGIVVNEDGGDKDTRIEGDTLTHMLFMDASAATENIALVATGAPNWQSMDRGLFIGDATTVPSGNPSSGGFLYVESGALKYRGSSGTVTTLGAA